MWQKHKIQLAKFDPSTLRVIWFCWACFWVASTADADANESPMDSESLKKGSPSYVSNLLASVDIKL
jgi:hypothetical protein